MVPLLHCLKDVGTVRGVLSLWDLWLLASHQTGILTVWAFHPPPLHGLLVPRPAPLCPFSSSCLCTCHYLTILRSDTLSGATFMFTRILFRYYILKVFKWQAVFYFISLLKDYFLYFSFVCARV